MESGFSASKSVIIPNGYDVSRFAPDYQVRARIRSGLGIPISSPVVAWIGRWHPDKAPLAALQAVGLAGTRLPNLHFIMAGNDCGLGGPAGAASSIIGLDLRRVHLLGRREDVPDLLAAADVLLLSSDSESFPNVLAEAMACGLPCVTTDVGDAADMVGSTGVVVPVADVKGMAAGVVDLLEESFDRHAERAVAARQRVIARYEMGLVAQRYVDLWHDVISRCGLSHES